MIFTPPPTSAPPGYSASPGRGDMPAASSKGRALQRRLRADDDDRAWCVVQHGLADGAQPQPRETAVTPRPTTSNSAPARALADLGHQLLVTTAADVQAVSHRPVHLDR